MATAQQHSRALTTVRAKGFDTDDEIALIKQHIAPGIPDDELDYFAAQCKRTGLDPFLKQIYCIPRGTGERRTWSVQTGIDGYRLLAARTLALAGIDDAIYDIEGAEHPDRASVTVYRVVGGVRCPFRATPRWAEYA